MRPEGFPEIQPHPEFDTDESRQEMFARMQSADHDLGDHLLEAPGVSRMEETDDGTEHYWVRSANVDPLARLTATSGPFIELGGPSHGDFGLVRVDKLPRQLITTNIDILTEGYDALGRSGFAYPDVRADGRQMPVRDQQAGAVFARFFGGILNHPREIPPEELAEGMKGVMADRGRALDEAWRMTEPGGVLVWEGGFRADIAYAAKLGFKPLMLHQHTASELSWNFEALRHGPNPMRIGEFWSAVMEKPTVPETKTEV